MIRKVDHLGLAVRSIDESLRFWSGALGLSVGGREVVASEGVEVAFLPAGDTRIELLESRDPASAVGRFVEKRGPGIHHVSFRVDDVHKTLEAVGAMGFALLDSATRSGAGGSRIAFLHPRASDGVLVELVESGTGASAGASFQPGEAVLAYLREPQEKVWGVLRGLDGAGLRLEGVDLGSFDDWIAQIERGEESPVGPSVLFLPMARVEKILLDRPSGSLPSLADRFRARTGASVQDVLARTGPDSAG